MWNVEIPEQHIAVFGESGSGKTVLLSSFYGRAQEEEFRKTHPYGIVSDEPGQGLRLHQNYLGMKRSSKLPEATRFASCSFPFSLAFRSSVLVSEKRKQQQRPRIIWHDYPGEWFEQQVSGEEEAQRRIDTFKNLLSSEVALILVDAQRLIDNEGEEERYLKALFTGFRNSLYSLKDALLPDGQRLNRCPRIWVIALSKADLLPDMTAHSFQDLVVEKAAYEIAELREVLTELVNADGALAVGEDFLLLSSARFGEEKIDTDVQIGLDLILPMAAWLPVERHARWQEKKLITENVAKDIISGATHLILEGLGKGTSLKTGVKGRILNLVPIAFNAASSAAEGTLARVRREAAITSDLFYSTLADFAERLEKAEEDKIFIRSSR